MRDKLTRLELQEIELSEERNEPYICAPFLLVPSLSSQHGLIFRLRFVRNLVKERVVNDSLAGTGFCVGNLVETTSPTYLQEKGRMTTII